MLTKQDLNQIKKITQDAVKDGTKTLTVDVKSLKIDVSKLEKSVSKLEKNVTTINHGLKKIDKKFDDLYDFLDKEHMSLVKRVVRIETNLNIQPLADF